MVLNNLKIDTIKLLANYLTFIISKNDKLNVVTQFNRFQAKTIPSIDILAYLSRILKYSPCGAEVFLAIAIYLERLSPFGLLKISSSNNQNVIIDSYNIHRLIISSALVSIKFLSDVFYTNMHVASFNYFLM